MKLSKVQITGFQSFRDSGEIEFEDGINLIVGQNNAGKSSLLRALQPDIRDDRNRSETEWETHALPQPSIILTVNLTGNEYKKALLRYPTSRIPVPSNEPFDSYLQRTLLSNSVQFTIKKAPQIFPEITLEQDGRVFDHYIHIESRNGEIIRQGNTGFDNTEPRSVSDYAINRNTFSFNAERMSIGESAHSHAERLTENANNLPSVLLTLQGERGDTFKKLVQHLREVFPNVGNLSVGPVLGGGHIEVRIWPTIGMPRRELSFPLKNSGTGVSQVIAILTAVMTVDDDAVIIIDEINSFLHPAAVKTLLRILQTEYSQHQYIISTHSPEVISFSNPSTVHLVKRTGYESTVHRLNLNQIDDFREVADHLGISMADVFAADNVIWVEGPTEELCFPLVYSHSTNTTLPPGTAFISVVATGDLSRKKRDRQLVGDDLSPNLPPIFGRVLGFQSGLMRPVFP